MKNQGGIHVNDHWDIFNTVTIELMNRDMCHETREALQDIDFLFSVICNMKYTVV